MPPLNPNFIRAGLAKSVAHGYFQSVVAVSHPHLLNSNNRPSFSRRQGSRFSRLHTLQAQAASAFHAEKQASAVAAGLADKRHVRTTSHGGIDAYLEARKKQDAGEAEAEEAEGEFSVVKFQNRIEWKPSPAAILLGDVKPAIGENGASLDRTHEALLHPEDEAALAHIDAALEVEARKRLDVIEEVQLAETAPKATTPAASAPVSRARTPDVEGPQTPASIALSATSPVDAQAQAFADHLQSLSEAGRYQEIPAVFEAMLAAHVRPITPAYNAYLVALINLSPRRNEVVAKSMAVYTKMLKEKVFPDSETYNILVDLLASRSLEVARLKQALEDKRLRFGGFKESGKFMLASHDLEFAILSEDDWLDGAVKLFDSTMTSRKISYAASTYHMMISACAAAGRTSDMLRIFEHMEANAIRPSAATFPAMITAFAKSGDLVSAVECYDEYKALAIASDAGESTLHGREDAQAYAAVIHGYVISDKLEGARKFYSKITDAYGVKAAEMNDALVAGGFVEALVQRGIYQDALQWAMSIEQGSRAKTMSRIATAAADRGDGPAAVAAFAQIPLGFADIADPSMALLALSIREGDVAAATRYWHVLNSPAVSPTSALIEPTIMYAVGLMLSGQVSEGLMQSELMFEKIRANESDRPQTAEEIEEAVAYIARFMAAHGISESRDAPSEVSPTALQSFASSPYPSTPSVASFEENHDPYAQNTDFKGSSLISDLLEGSNGRKGPRLGEALVRFKNIRRAGRHPRYITYAKLISAAAREGKLDLCHDILAMARSDVPLLHQYPAVRYGWSSILDAMIGACLSCGNRGLAEQFHQELLSFGATPTANTYGLYITTLKESTKTFDEASEAVKIFHRARAEGVEPSSFLYNALIGKLGKARRIDDCLLYFSEMRRLGVKPTSVTYGTLVNALCRVSDEKLAEELFDEMESVPNYKARPAPYNSMMQFFLTTKRDKSKVLAYYERMKARGISPTSHTYKLLMDTHASLEPVDMQAAEKVLEMIKSAGLKPEPVHYAALIHARGCVLQDVEGARKTFDAVVAARSMPTSASVFQAMVEVLVANHRVADTESILELMGHHGVGLTPYIANSLIHGWAAQKNIEKSRSIYDSLGLEKREPSTYEAMTRAFLSVEQRENAQGVVREMLGRGYPNAVVNKTLELLGGGEEMAE